MPACCRIHVAKASQALIIVVAIVTRRFIPLTHDHIRAIALRAAGSIRLRAVVIPLASRVALHRVRAFAAYTAAGRAFKAKVTEVGRHF